ncbi:hypothetical protein BJF81_15675 [Ornithinimicrobium sp. CNJ-824]|uniref:hypothetical protein n=1 Tax=Ornithinimicrobium sp. CNJ-824 TaxID=1904966 RepID=UPI00096094C0|nr:hypothetical protein [Ornithinimicrobium sp. CNJ-824]OLT21162.1 hypothetical protein BJF81_15675 [Ornithinimicrobium sp. CNJ-824]
MTSEPSELLRELVSVIVQDDVRYVELTARAEPVSDPFEEPRFGLRVDVEDPDDRRQEDRLHVAFNIRVDISSEVGVMSVVARAEYHVPIEKADLLAKPVTMEFANHVAVMTLVPYLREALSDVSLRVFDQRIVMPMFKRGELWFSDEPEPASNDDDS